MPPNFYLALASVAGVLVAMQGVINSRLNHVIGGASLAALLSFAVGLLTMLVLNGVLVLTGRVQLSSVSGVTSMPWWLWLGGAFGAFFVALAAAVIPRVGAASFVGVVIVTQLTSAAVLDHVGAFGIDPRPVSLTRIGGLALFAAGVVLISRG